MNVNQVTSNLALAKEFAPKRKFKQTYDLIINLRGINLKNNEQQLDFYVPLHFSKGKKTKVCALVGPELKEQASKLCDTTLLVDDFDAYAKDKKLAKKLARSHDYFIAQATIMPKVATAFGRVLGPRGKMPNPKAGCVVPPNANLTPLYERLQKMARVIAKTTPVIQVPVGTEGMPDAEVADNILNIYNQVLHHVPNEKQNIGSMFIKLTMGKSVPLGVAEEEIRKRFADAEKARQQPKPQAHKSGTTKKVVKTEKTEKSAPQEKPSAQEKDKSESEA